jgi:hypothetical protein
MAINNNDRWGVRMNPPDVLKAKMGARRSAARSYEPDFDWIV